MCMRMLPYVQKGPTSRSEVPLHLGQLILQSGELTTADPGSQLRQPMTYGFLIPTLQKGGEGGTACTHDLACCL